MNTPSTRIAIAEDDANTLEALVGLVAAEPEFELVGAASDGAQAIERFPILKPDLVIMDIELPHIDGVECVRRLKEDLPDAEFLMLTVFETHEKVFDALRAGAAGYLVKRLSAGKLIDALKDLRDGGSPMSSSIARQVVRCFREPGPPGTSVLLSVREQEVLKRLSEGQRYKEIAAELSLSAHTVRTHLRRIYKKLQVRTKAEAASAYRQGKGA